MARRVFGVPRDLLELPRLGGTIEIGRERLSDFRVETDESPAALGARLAYGDLGAGILTYAALGVPRYRTTNYLLRNPAAARQRRPDLRESWADASSPHPEPAPYPWL